MMAAAHGAPRTAAAAINETNPHTAVTARIVRNENCGATMPLIVPLFAATFQQNSETDGMGTAIAPQYTGDFGLTFSGWNSCFTLDLRR